MRQEPDAVGVIVTALLGGLSFVCIRPVFKLADEAPEKPRLHPGIQLNTVCRTSVN